MSWMVLNGQNAQLLRYFLDKSIWNKKAENSILGNMFFNTQKNKKLADL